MIEAGYMDPEDKIKGSEQHYDFFESLLTGIFCSKHVIHIYQKTKPTTTTFILMADKGRRVGGEEPGEQWRRIFPAQVTTCHFIY